MKVEVHELRQPLDLFEVFHLHLWSPTRDAQEQFSGFATLQGEGETDALNSSNSREESERHQGAVQLVSVLREWDKGCG